MLESLAAEGVTGLAGQFRRDRELSHQPKAAEAQDHKLTRYAASEAVRKQAVLIQ